MFLTSLNNKFQLLYVVKTVPLTKLHLCCRLPRAEMFSWRVTLFNSCFRDLDLKKPIYQHTAAYGHFGRDVFSWEVPKKLMYWTPPSCLMGLVSVILLPVFSLFKIRPLTNSHTLTAFATYKMPFIHMLVHIPAKKKNGISVQLPRPEFKRCGQIQIISGAFLFLLHN